MTNLIVCINGESVRVEVESTAQLHVVRAEALQRTSNAVRPFDNWEIRGENGRFLETHLTVAELTEEDIPIFVTLRLGAGG